MEWFDKNIRKPIELFQHPVWFVLRNQDVSCTCVDFVSKQSDKECIYCLGTGNKVSLARVNAAHQNNRLALRGAGLGFSEKDIVNVYYTFAKTSIKNGDIVVDGEDVDVVQDVYYEHSDEQKTVYWRIETSPYKYDRDKFKKTMASLLKEVGFDG